MKYYHKLLLFYVIKSIYANSVPKADQVSKEVDKLIGKILHADKFNELADRIADRAVIKLNDFQKTTKNEAVYRSLDMKTGKDKSDAEIMEPKKHKHGKIDADAVLRKKALPLDGLKLRYKNLRNLHYMTHLKDSKKDASSSSISEENKKFQKIGKNLKQDYEKIEAISDEIVENPIDIDETNNNPNMSSTTVRLEGNKTFAWMDSPDYKEYHEQLAKLKEALS